MVRSPVADSSSKSGADDCIRFASGLSTRRDARDAADDLCDRIRARAGGIDSFDLGLLHITRDLVGQAEAIERTVHERLGIGTLLTVSASGVVGGAMQVREAPGVSLLAGSLPGVDLHPFVVQDIPRPSESAGPEWGREHIAPVLGLDRDDARAVMLFTDPYSVPLVRLLPLLGGARPDAGVPILGGVASSGRAPGQNVLGQNGGLMNVGGVGVTLSGAIEVDTAVSQGCLGFGPTMVVTKCRGNVLLELGGRRAIEAVREAVLELDADERTQLGRGLFVGRVINEYKDRFGRDDFLIRGIRGFDEDAGAVLTDDFFRVGQTIRLHYRDTRTAEADLGMVLDRERLRPKPAGALLITCRGREGGPAGGPGLDAGAVSRAHEPRAHGADAAKGGQAFEPAEPAPIPMAGFESAGEIGPVGDGVFLHTQSAVMAFFRERVGG
jgi:small ligand-binding sensory domain FIST